MVKLNLDRLRKLKFGVMPELGAWSVPAGSALFVMVILSALAVIYNAYHYRLLFNEHQQQLQQRDGLQVEWGQLLLEQSALAAHSRIERAVTRKLDMYVPAPHEIVVVKP
ncbi:cell division protein FtsL [Motiliproteus sediminis]|uniref:cell division protein FtsL n=1 Tax=Motiliproteus sediminis TaxID=1468178 RepID=UPI001AEFBCCB|nr:cell division protein FtsL [Motiliproteus sediminis]